MTGNHLADQAEREYNDGDRCPECRRHMNEIYWCEEEHDRCVKCRAAQSAECEYRVEKLYCHYCRIALDID